MANYPKTRKKDKIVKMADGWEKTTNIPGLPDTTRYTRLYGNNKVYLYHKRGSNEYTYGMGQDGKYITEKFRAKSLQKAKDGVDIIVENWNLENGNW